MNITSLTSLTFCSTFSIVKHLKITTCQKKFSSNKLCFLIVWRWKKSRKMLVTWVLLYHCRKIIWCNITCVAMEPNNEFSSVFLFIYEIFRIAHTSVAILTAKYHLAQTDFVVTSYHCQYKMYSGLHVKCPIFLSNFNQAWSSLTDFICLQYQISCKTIQWQPSWCMRTDTWPEMTT
jgi:hypothetical protein